MDINKFSRYEIRGEVGRGGMATVYRAFDPLFEREVALKILNRELLSNSQVRERFERETKIIAKLEHPAIVPVYDVGRDNEQLFFVMRYMAGGSLSDRTQAGKLPLAEIVRIVTRLGTALDYAHAKGIIHRDLKPGNILFDEENNAFISDFGIAKFAEASVNLTASGIVGTPTYMSPEQAMGEEVDGRSDIYSLGVMLFEMLSGKTPFEADSPIAMAFKHATERPPDILAIDPKLSPEIQYVIDKVLAKNRHDRYQTGSELARAVSRVLSTDSERLESEPEVVDRTIAQERVTKNESTLYPAQRESSRRSLSWVYIPLILISFLVGFFLLSRLITPPLPVITPTAVLITDTPTITPTLTQTPTKTPSPTSTPTQPVIPTAVTPGWFAQNSRFITISLAVVFLLAGFVGVWGIVAGNNGTAKESAPVTPEKSAEALQKALSTTTLATNLLAEIDPKRRKELLFLIGRKPELRLKDKLVYYGGGRYILHGFGRFGATALIDQIVKIAEYEFNQLSKIQEKGVIMMVRIDAGTLEEKNGEVNGVIKEFKYGAKHANLAHSFKSQMDRLYNNRLAEVNSSTDEKTISVKAAPLPGIEAQFSRKLGASSSKVTGDDLLKLVADFLDRAEKQEPNSLDVLIDKLLKSTTLPARIIFVIDHIKSEAVFGILKRMSLFDDDRITFFGIVRQERYLEWKKDEELINMIKELKFQFHYVSSLWEEKTNFVQELIDNAFQYKVVGHKDLLVDFKDHIAFMSRGAPGDAIYETLKTDYCEYPFGEPKLNLEKIRNLGDIKMNAKLQRILAGNWDVIFGTRFKNARDEDEDRARRAVYKLIDWFNSKLIFTLEEAQANALSTSLRISDADSICLNILDVLLAVLVEEKYLHSFNENYGVAELTTLEDIQRNGAQKNPKKDTAAGSKKKKQTGKSNSSEEPA